MADDTTVFENNVSVTGNLTVTGTINAGSETQGPTTITAANANALAVGRLGTTTPALQVDTATTLSATGLKITAAASLSGVALAAIGGAAENLTIDAKGTGTVTINGTATGAITLGAATGVTGALTVTSTSASALTVGRQGATDPVLKINANTASVATGISITGAAAAGGVAVAAISSGTDESLTINAKGSGTVTINGTATGNIVLGAAMTGVSASLTGGYTAKSGTSAPASAGALAAGAPISMFSNGIKVWVTTDAPAFSATKGDLGINLAGSSSSTRLFINNGTTNWVAITTAS